MTPLPTISTREKATLRHQPRRWESSRAFSLIEAVVVIAILAVTATVVFAFFPAGIEFNNPRRGSSAMMSSKHIVTWATMQTVREGTIGRSTVPLYGNNDTSVMGYMVDLGGEFPTNITQLTKRAVAWNPVTKLGSRAPYISAALVSWNTLIAGGWTANSNLLTTLGWRREYVDEFVGASWRDGAAPVDAWGNPIVIQIPTGANTDRERLKFSRIVSAGPDGRLTAPIGVRDPYLNNVQWNLWTNAVGDDLVLFFELGYPTPGF